MLSFVEFPLSFEDTGVHLSKPQTPLRLVSRERPKNAILYRYL